MTSEEANQQARRRIQEAEQTFAVRLHLSGLALDRLPADLERLTWLQELYIRECTKITDLSPVARLTSIRRLDMPGCTEVSDLTPWHRLHWFSASIYRGVSTSLILHPWHLSLRSIISICLFAVESVTFLRLEALLPLRNSTLIAAVVSKSSPLYDPCWPG
jgi:hypothetical protein